MTKKSNIYTGGGDRGETALIGGRRVPKYHSRIEAYGEVDELMAHTSLLRDMLEDEELREDLLKILELQMVTASILAVDLEPVPEGIPTIQEAHISFLEERIDTLDARLEPLHSFVIPGGHPAISQAHVARTVCRRTERTILRLMQENKVDERVIRFYNRLSDYFFVVSRIIAALFEVQQKPWKTMLHE